MNLNIKYNHPNAKTPVYATAGAACFDLYAAEKTTPTTFETGLSFEIPEGHVMLVFSRSGDGFNRGLSLVNSVGVIDSDYRGTVSVKFNAPSPHDVGDRIAQAMVLPISQVQFNVVESLSDTSRGIGGYGSTGQK